MGLYARTAVPGGPAENTPIAGVDPLVAHDYSIDWTPTEVRYFVDGALVATHTIAITAQLRPVASDFAVGGGSVQVGSLELYSYPSPGTFTSRVFDAGDARATWRTLTAAATTPAGTGVAFEVRTGSTPTPDASWTAWQPVGPGGAIPGPVGRRYLQYRATLTTTDSGLTPSVQSVTLGYEVDSSAPAATITDVTVTGTTARVTFSSTATDVARLECSLDNGPYATCTSPRDYTNLSGGSHTIRVRAIDQVGNVGAAAERSFTVDTTAPAVTIADVTVTGTSARVTFSSTATDVARFECSLDNGPYATCTSPRDYTNLSGGSHTVRVRAIDQVGNVGAAAERSFTVDTTAPAAAITDVTVTGTTARVTFTSEAGARFECSLDNGPFETCTSPRDYTDLSGGSHTIRVRAIDQAGNVGAAAERSFVISSPPTPDTPTPDTPTPDTTAPKVRPKPKTVYVSNRGRFKVRLSCPSNETRCRIALTVRYRGKPVAGKTVTLLGGQTRTVTLRLKPSARTALNRNSRLRVTAFTTARDAAGNRATTQTRMRLRD